MHWFLLLVVVLFWGGGGGRAVEHKFKFVTSGS